MQGDLTAISQIKHGLEDPDQVTIEMHGFTVSVRVHNASHECVTLITKILNEDGQAEYCKEVSSRSKLIQQSPSLLADSEQELKIDLLLKTILQWETKLEENKTSKTA